MHTFKFLINTFLLTFDSICNLFLFSDSQYVDKINIDNKQQYFNVWQN